MGEELELDARQIDYGHDRTLLQQNLARSPAQRIVFGASFANWVLRNRGLANAS